MDTLVWFNFCTFESGACALRAHLAISLGTRGAFRGSIPSGGRGSPVRQDRAIGMSFRLEVLLVMLGCPVSSAAPIAARVAGGVRG